MDVIKAAPIDPASGRGTTTATPTPGPTPASTPTTAITSQQGSALPDSVAPLLDRVDIKPLDLVSALQILLAELSAELELTAELAVAAELTLASDVVHPGLSASAGTLTPRNPAAAPQALVQIFLQALPEETQDVSVWLGTVVRAEAAVVTALDRGVDVIAGWRNVPSAVVDGARETRAVVLAALTDDPPNSMWLRPEWLGLAPGIHRFWRRRRLARRGLSDPDPRAHERDDETRDGETQDHRANER